MKAFEIKTPKEIFARKKRAAYNQSTPIIALCAKKFKKVLTVLTLVAGNVNEAMVGV
jgi:hypothetical protein